MIREVNEKEVLFYFLGMWNFLNDCKDILFYVLKVNIKLLIKLDEDLRLFVILIL